MNNYLKLSWIPSLMVIAGLILVSSCKDDDPPAKAGVSFELAEQEVNESDGTIEVKVVLDKAASGKVVLAYELSGTAAEGEATGDDYKMMPEGGYITIEAGETEAAVEIELYEDLDVEIETDDDGIITNTTETIIVTLTEVVSGPAELGEQSVYTMTVYEDDLLVQLTWDTGDGNPDDVDMDIFIWHDDPEDDPDEGFFMLNPDYVGGIRIGTDYEVALLVGGFPEGDYGFSFVYYSGTSDNLTFTVQYLNLAGTVNGSEQTQKTGSLNLVNLNPWDDDVEGTDPIMVQNMEKVGLNFVNLSDITKPDAGSRIKTFNGKMDLSNARKGEMVKARFDPKILQ